MDPMLYACAAVFVAILLYFVNKGKQNNEERKPRARPVRVENDGPGGRRQAARRRGIGARIQEQEARREELNAERDSDELDEDGEPKEKTKEKIGAKKLRKLQDKEQKKVQREAELREREEQKKRREEKDKDIREKEEQELFEQKREEEEEEKIRLEKERLEMEEYLKLKEEFSIEEEGEQEGEVDESEMENLLQQFIDYVKETKVIFLEDLASHFGLRVQDAIDRVQSLLEQGTLTGVIDDRGKFIYISMEELRGVADFINNQGRISITELAKASNSLINLKQDEEVLVLGEAA